MCEKYNSSAAKCIDSFNKNRSFFMGVSMLAVLLFHAYIAWGGLFIFKYGFIGVDSFLFLSGYGLCFFYKKNSIWSFWLRRLKRIMPKYIVHDIYILKCSFYRNYIQVSF